MKTENVYFPQITLYISYYGANRVLQRCFQFLQLYLVVFAGPKDCGGPYLFFTIFGVL